MEPGTSIIRRSGRLVASVVDVFLSGGKKVVVLDASVNQMPESFEFQFEPDVEGDLAKGGHGYILSGATCLAGDIFGEYFLAEPLVLGSRVILKDMGAYTMVKAHIFKRINAPRTTSGATWAPNTVTWTGNNRTHMVRAPDPGRFELRLPDGAANPYLMQAVILTAGLDGIQTKADPGRRYDIDMYTKGHTVKGAPKLPLNLLDALREYDKDKTLKALMGAEFSAAYLKLKHQEWNSFVSHFSRWEHENTLDI